MAEPPRRGRTTGRRVLGVDVGGTFTDFVYVEGGRARIAKRPSTPSDPGRAIIDGLRELGWSPTDVVHGSTVATNTLLTRTGAPTALITTRGFRDTLEIGRQARPDLYELHPTRREPLVGAELRFEVGERVAADGEVIEPLDEAGLEAVLDRIVAAGVGTVAICFLFSFINPAHEQRAADAARARGLNVSVSHEVLPQHREYERTSTTVANAYLAPVMTDYLERLERLLTDEVGGGRPVTLRIMQSNGGSLSASGAGEQAVRTVLSGPAGGVAGAFGAAAAVGHEQAITFDMGGTSADVSLCPGRLLERTDLTIDGMPIRTPAVDVHTVGAGGGSIAWFDAGGALRVGPQSAGADPGPAAYGRGELPTVTDAHAALGRLRPEYPLGGTIGLVPERAIAALQTIVAPFGGDVARAAAAVIDVVNANMARALRVISVERGYDPARFTLVAFGGAGPLHACDLADALGIPAALIPTSPGVLSASGMLSSDVTRDAERGIHFPIPDVGQVDTDALTATYRELRERARAAIAEDGYRSGVQIQYAADLRYQGQSHELTVGLTSYRSARVIREAFQVAHEERFGFRDDGRTVELVTARVKARARGHDQPSAIETAGVEIGESSHDVVWDRARRTRFIDRSQLRERVAGPAVITQVDTTTLVPPGWQASVLEDGALLLERA